MGTEVHQYLCPNPANVQFMLPSGTVKQLCLDCSARWSQRWNGQTEAEREEREGVSEETGKGRVSIWEHAQPSAKGEPMSRLEKALVGTTEERTRYVLREDLEKLEAIQADTAKVLRLPDIPGPTPREPSVPSDIGLVVTLDDLGLRIRVQTVLAERILNAVQAMDHRLS